MRSVPLGVAGRRWTPFPSTTTILPSASPRDWIRHLGFSLSLSLSSGQSQFSDLLFSLFLPSISLSLSLWSQRRGQGALPFDVWQELVDCVRSYWIPNVLFIFYSRSSCPFVVVVVVVGLCVSIPRSSYRPSTRRMTTPKKEETKEKTKHTQKQKNVWSIAAPSD